MGKANVFIYLCICNYWGLRDNGEGFALCPGLEPREDLESGSARKRPDVILTADEAVRRCGLMVSPWAELPQSGQPATPGLACFWSRELSL